MEPFTHDGWPARVVFGRGAVRHTGREIQRLGCGQALVLATPGRRADARALADRLGPLAAGVYAGAVQHTPVEVTDHAVQALADAGADCLVALGGGSAIGLAKALAARTGVAQVVIPTTYAGSEVTPVLGETADGLKRTRRGPEILPEAVVYDPDLTDQLPVRLSLTSGLNAMAHALEGVYAPDRSPLHTLLAREGLRALHGALPALVRAPTDRAARDRALYGAWLCGTVLGGVGMSVHHKLCHTVGAALDLPHADVHAVLLPHTMAFVEQAVPQALAPVTDIFGPRVGAGLHAYAAALGAPLRLADLGVEPGVLDRMADLAIADPYWSPRELDRDAVRALLHRAWAGQAPS
jgi:maleylacetate reductase